MTPKNAAVRLLFCVTISLMLASAAYGQDSAAPPEGTIELKKNPIEVLKELEPAADAPYELGRGDEISVEVAGRPELTSKHVVGPDGEITLPIVGSVTVVDKTRDEAAKVIQSALANYYDGVNVSVGVEHYSSNHILLLGAVEHPGLMSFDRAPLLLEVISRGGMQSQTTAGGNGTPASIGAPAYPDECVIYRGSNIVFTVELKQLLEEDHNLADYRLKRDDIVYVPGNSKYVAFFGQVLRPGTLRLHNSSTLPQLLAEAGGPTEKAGQNPKIQIIHRGSNGLPGKTQFVSYKEILQPGPIDLTLHSGDIIYVPESGLNKAGDTFEKIAPLVNLITIGAVLH